MEGASSGWHFLTNHAHVLLCISDDHDATVRELAQRVGITERAVIRIVGELDEAGYLERTREGRRNHYTIQHHRPLRHHVEAHRTVGDLIEMYRFDRG
ncbi:MAG: winged helix-turn-helix domain-containing protein [Gemmatimonadota bacterium]|nr:winged helix-turn-helix domain-containing protein [Gemmatimonadota bacterium]